MRLTLPTRAPLRDEVQPGSGPAPRGGGPDRRLRHLRHQPRRHVRRRLRLRERQPRDADHSSRAREHLPPGPRESRPADDIRARHGAERCDRHRDPERLGPRLDGGVSSPRSAAASQYLTTKCGGPPPTGRLRRPSLRRRCGRPSQGSSRPASCAWGTCGRTTRCSAMSTRASRP